MEFRDEFMRTHHRGCVEVTKGRGSSRVLRWIYEEKGSHFTSPPQIHHRSSPYFLAYPTPNFVQRYHLTLSPSYNNDPWVGCGSRSTFASVFGELHVDTRSRLAIATQKRSLLMSCDPGTPVSRLPGYIRGGLKATETRGCTARLAQSFPISNFALWCWLLLSYTLLAIRDWGRPIWVGWTTQGARC